MPLTKIEKPPYRVPLMAEINAVEPNGFKIVSTFSGCGGSCLGFRMAGFGVLWASEFIPAARETYLANYPTTPLDDRDIRLVTPEDILNATGLGVGELDVLEGSPPCASFSTAGRREKGWGQVKQYSDTKQRVDDLFEYIRLLKGLRPKVFVAENVSGLIKGTAKGYFLEILQLMKDAGYRVGAQVLDAQWLGVPQARTRVIFVGVRKDLNVDPAFPTPLRYRYSVRDALPWISAVKTHSEYDVRYSDAGVTPSPAITAGGARASNKATHHGGQVTAKITGRTGPGFTRVACELDKPMNSIIVTDPAQTRYEVEGATDPECNWNAVSGRERTIKPSRPSPTIQQNGRSHAALLIEERIVEPETDIARHAIGREWDNLKAGEQSKKYFSLVRPALDEPSGTITQLGGLGGVAGVVHPTEKRKFSIFELKRICAFPDDFILTGSYAQQWERLGRAVPPLMMRAVAEVVRDEILAKLPAGTPKRARRSPASSRKGSGRKGAVRRLRASRATRTKRSTAR